MNLRSSKVTLSIAMATYNGEDFLRQQLDSIASQTLLPQEMIICDDASTDRTMAILEDFKRTSSFPVRLFRNAENLRSTANFEKAIRLCQGDVVVLSDQDDVWRRDKLQKICEAFERRPSAVGVLSDAELIDSTGQGLNRTLWDSFRLSRQERQSLVRGGLPAFRLLLRKNVITGAAFAFRRDRFFDSTGVIPGSWVHDAWIAINLCRKGPIELIPDCLIGYRQHDANQIGVKPVPFRDRLYNLAAISDARFRMTFLRQFLDGPDVEKEYLSLVDAKIAHLEVRINKRRRILPLVIELLSGRYRQYSAGINSFLITHVDQPPFRQLVLY